MAAASLQIQLLGELQVWRGGVLEVPRSKKSRRFAPMAERERWRPARIELLRTLAQLLRAPGGGHLSLAAREWFPPFTRVLENTHPRGGGAHRQFTILQQKRRRVSDIATGMRLAVRARMHSMTSLPAAALGFALLAGSEMAEAAPADESSELGAGEGSFPSLIDRGLLSGQWLWAQGKITPGIELGLGVGPIELDLELAFVGMSQSSPGVDGKLLGNQLGAYLMFTPVRERYYDASLGLGGDVYLLWGIHSDVAEAALAPRAMLRFWPLENLALSVSARAYLLESEGLELGTTRGGSSGSPILIGTGLTWGFL